MYNNKNVKIMEKNLFLAALAFIALVSCTSDEFVGENTPPTTSNTAGAIQFTSNAPRITRADDHATSASNLGYSFNVYATKTTEGATNSDPDVTTNVFALNDYNATSNTPYQVWYIASTANNTTSNTYDWEYVGTNSGSPQPEYGTDNYKVKLGGEQTIKYWDYSAKNYVFTAYKAKPVNANVAAGTVSNVTTTGFTFQGTADQFANLYVADKLTITDKANPAAHTTADNKIGDVVKFTFRSGAAKVRLGIYETILGYNVKNVNFKPTSPANFAETTTQAQLSGSFNGDGSSNVAAKTFTVTYGSDGVAQFSTTATKSNNFIFGTFDTDDDPTPSYLKESSADPTWANASNDYINVLPNQDPTSPMVLSVDYDLYNTVTHETIHVEDAKAVVPVIYMKWNPNYAYTYLFKISDNTNGYTGPGTMPSGLYPISFDAVTIAGTDVLEGTITTVSTPSITTYQDGSVSTEGITYANANGIIYITVNTDGALENLAGNVKLYEVAAATTEADLMYASNYAKTEITSGDDALTVLNAPTTVKSVTFAANTTAKFTPTDGKTYAFEFSKEAVSESYVAATGTYVYGTTYYTDNTGTTEVDTSSFEEGTTDVSSYYVKIPASPAVKVYKVIKVVAASGGSGSGD